MLQKRYNPKMIEPDLHNYWQESGIYRFDPSGTKPVFSIDTPPPTVSGNLHLGHTFSYSHPDFIARFYRMNGYNVFYPMGFDNNGLPTGRLVEKEMGIRASDIGREEFINACHMVSAKAEQDYKHLWDRLGLSVDWSYTYRTIDPNAQVIAQTSFLRLQQMGLVYQKNAPTIWCIECGTAFAQAELDDKVQQGNFLTLKFKLTQAEEFPDENDHLLIATTRPELLPACVAIFIHPDDLRYQSFLGRNIEVPLFGQEVPILSDPLVDPGKGTGVVMCCTFGDQTDIAWWQKHDLPLVQAIDRDGCMTDQAGPYQGLSIKTARAKIIQDLKARNHWQDSHWISHEVRVHERCDTPVEYISTHQWFIRILNFKSDLLKIGESVKWIPNHMRSRFQSWVDNLSWDWCISRQRYYGVPFPVWYCQDCGRPAFAKEDHLPSNPLVDIPDIPCIFCGSRDFSPDLNVMDTWATSSLSPQIAGQWLNNPSLYEKVYPFSLRAQAHEIIRTWAFYTIVKSHFHFKEIPWENALISGWGVSPQGMGKISKSRGGGPMPPLEMINKYSADAVRYWAASTGPGKDSIISEEKIQLGSKLVTKLWNVARFSSQFLHDFDPNPSDPVPNLTPADQWILSKTQDLIQRVTNNYQAFEYASAKAETEKFFWNFTDNYLEMTKQRLYENDHPLREGAQYTLFIVLKTLIKLFAPILPHVTERIYQGIFSSVEGNNNSDSKPVSIHITSWPEYNPDLINLPAETLGDTLVNIASQVRRYKSENNLSLGSKISRVKLALGDSDKANELQKAILDLKSITRADHIEIIMDPNEINFPIAVDESVNIQIVPSEEQNSLNS